MEPSRGRGGEIYIAPFLLTALGALGIAELMFLSVPRDWSTTTRGRVLIFWPVMLLIAYLGARLFTAHVHRSATEERTRGEALGHIEYLQAINALLRTLARAQELTRSLHELAGLIRDIVPCDRLGLALLTEDGEAFRTYTARLDAAPGAERQARPDLHFARKGTLLGEVVRARHPRIIEDVGEFAADYLDANVLKTAGFVSTLLVPLVFEHDVFGTLNLVSRRPAAFSERDLRALTPVAEALATAYAARRLATTAARHEAAQEIADNILEQSSDIGSAVQSLLGQCELLARESPDPAVQRDATLMMQQARRISDALARLQRATALDN